MNGRLKLKGRVFTHLIYPCIMSVVLFVVGIWITVIDSDAGSIILSLAIVYLIFTIVMYVVNQKLVMQELIKFAVDYAQVQKELLDDMVIPYGLIDRQGNILWQDGEMSHLLRREYGKRVPEVFKEITDEHLELGDEIKEMHINFKDHFYRVQLKRVDTDKAFNNTEILDIENQEYVIAMYMFDETRLRKIEKENFDQKLVVGLIYIDNYEEVLQSVEDVRASLLAALIDRKINKFVSNIDGIVRKLEKDKYFMVLKRQSLEAIRSEKFDIVDDVKTVSIGNELQVTISIGIGMGAEKTLTLEGKKAFDEAELLIGAKRMTDAVQRPGQMVLHEYRSDKIVEYIKAHPQYRTVAIALSGDVGFYSGARKLLEVLCQDSADLRVQRKNGSEKSEEERDSSAQNNTEIEIQCGISSVVYFMSQIGLSWDDAKIVSAHGRGCNLISHICYAEKVFSILGTSDGVAVLAEKLVKYGMGDVLLYVGENLSYENEKIFVKPASELTEYKGDPLSVICAVNENAGTRLETHGIRDEEFIRGKAPMTKEEVRTVSLSKLRLTADSVCYDVGAGTGSLSVEMALRAHQGQVWAIEKKEDAVELIHRNKVKFAADNLEIVEGLAPEALKDLPAPTHAFIGGSSGNLKEIVKLLLEKNPQVRIVINCITLETVSEALETAKEFGFEENEIVQLSAARSKAIGRYHMMMGENPIYIITLQNPGK